jgi:Ca2+/Na+ antiporter
LSTIRRKTTFFEKVLLGAGFFMGFLGFHIINQVYISSGRVMSYEMVIAVLLWIIMLFLIIITATSESQKEESQIIASELHDETKLVREFIKEQILEVKQLREDISKLKKK